MPQTPYIERHSTASNTVRDIVIGMSDGLTVPFALAAGLSGATQTTSIIVTAGLAEIAAGSTPWDQAVIGPPIAGTGAIDGKRIPAAESASTGQAVDCGYYSSKGVTYERRRAT
jgi:hypothetical protein